MGGCPFFWGRWVLQWEPFAGGHIGPGGRSVRQRRAGRDGGTPYLGHGFRRPNFVPKFGASVIGIGPYGGRGMRIPVTSAPNFRMKFGWRWLHPRCVTSLLAMTGRGVFPLSLHFVENFFRERGGSPLDGEGKRCYLESLQARMGLAARSRGRKCPPVCPVSGKRVWMRPNSGGTTDRFDSP